MIITSLLDLDLYKLTVGQIIFTYFRNINARYRLTVRNAEKISYWNYMNQKEYNEQIQALKNLSLTADEADYLRKLDLFSEDYIQFLMNRPMDNVEISWHDERPDIGDLKSLLIRQSVPEVYGEWVRAMLYEIFCLSISNELFARNYAKANEIPESAVWEVAKHRLLDSKIGRLKFHPRPLTLTEFGTRRRMSKKWQEYVIDTLNFNGLLDGTSNVYFAKILGIQPRSTFGHEATMGMQGIVRIQDSQKEFFLLWLQHWKGKLKIALDDTLGDKKFFRDFTQDLAEAYDGLRHDSGNWQIWGRDRIAMYERFRIDPRTKTLFFSDGLTDREIVSIDNAFSGKVKLGFGVGTFLTNDSCLPVPQVVMKIIECNGQPVCKLSNNPAKASCTDPEYLRYVQHVAENY